MSTQHSKAAKEFLKNQQYAHWHDATFWAVRSKRDNMAYGLDEWEQLREKASQIKRHTITHMDEYLDQFATAAEKNGVEVHWAKDAQEFNEIVYGILKNHNVKKMVKSKSMLTEECGMNPYLEAHGIEVVETDLGERIIQLKGQAPSHIVMPAIHLNHDDVGELFEEKGISNEKGNHDPTYLTYRARLSLRNEFLTADAGMTGANFGIAETGDIVVCTNEGNARGQCRHEHKLSETAHCRHRIGKNHPQLRLSRRLPTYALSCWYGSANDNVYESFPQGPSHGSSYAHRTGGQRPK